MTESPRIIAGQSHAAYHADPAPTPSLSASIAQLLVDRSPLHAWNAHPRLNPDFAVREPTEEMDEGSALHTLVLGRGAPILEVPFGDWRTDEAKYQRRTGRRHGAAPILKARLKELHEAAVFIRRELRRSGACAGLFYPGKAEATCLWREAGSWCRIRVDWMPDAGDADYDLKFTSKSAAPAAWEREVWQKNALRSAFYRAGLTACRGGTAPREYRLVVAETRPPFGVSVFAAAPDVLEYGADQMHLAVELWGICMKLRRRWPSYATTVQYVELPGWLLERWEATRGAARMPLSKRPTVAQVEHVQRLSAEIGRPLW
jgi:hypothetical protein